MNKNELKILLEIFRQELDEGENHFYGEQWYRLKKYVNRFLKKTCSATECWVEISFIPVPGITSVSNFCSGPAAGFPINEAKIRAENALKTIMYREKINRRINNK